MRCRVAVKVGTSLVALHRSSSYNWRAVPDDVQNLRSIGPGRNKSVRSGQGRALSAETSSLTLSLSLSPVLL